MKPLLMTISIILISVISYGQSAFEYFSIGLVKYNLRDFEKAITDFDKALEANPEFSEVYNLRGASRFNLGDLEGAIEDYSMAIELERRQTGGVRLTVYDQRGRMIESANQAMVDPSLAAPYYNRAIARVALQDYQGAIEDYTSALDIDPDLMSAFFFRGELKHRTGDRHGACSDWKRAEELGVIEAAELLKEYCYPEPE
jgi:tetratricopeptide (TPR) repeat protein